MVRGVRLLTWALLVLGPQVWSVAALAYVPKWYIPFPWHVLVTVLSIALGDVVCKELKYWTLIFVYPPVSCCGLVTGWPLYASLWFPLWGVVLDLVANVDNAVLAKAVNPREAKADGSLTKSVDLVVCSRLPVVAAAVTVFVNLLMTWALVMHGTLGEAFLGGLACGVFTGSAGLTAAHEMWHRTGSKVEWFFGRAVLVIVGYGHFVVDHLHGHHRLLPDDPATACYGESFFKFWPRFVKGEFMSAWQKGKQETLVMMALTGVAAVLGSSLCSITPLATFVFVLSHIFLVFCMNGYVPSVGLILGYLFATMPATMLVFFFSHAFWVFFISGIVNYMQHYGLERFDGEVISELHSWQSAARYTNSLLFNIARHSHHHSRRNVTYDNLKLIDGAPTVPLGYFALVWLALNPPLWFRLMNPLVRNARRVRYDRPADTEYRAGPTPHGPLEVIDQGLLVGFHYIVRTYSFFWFALAAFSLLTEVETTFMGIIDLIAPLYRDSNIVFLAKQSLKQFPTTLAICLALRPVVFAQGLILNLTWILLVSLGVYCKRLGSFFEIQRCVTRHALQDNIIFWCDFGLHAVPLILLTGRTSLETDVEWYHIVYAFVLSRFWNVAASIAIGRFEHGTWFVYNDVSDIYNLKASHRDLLTWAYWIETIGFIALLGYKLRSQIGICGYEIALVLQSCF